MLVYEGDFDLYISVDCCLKAMMAWIGKIRFLKSWKVHFTSRRNARFSLSLKEQNFPRVKLSFLGQGLGKTCITYLLVCVRVKIV